MREKFSITSYGVGHLSLSLKSIHAADFSKTFRHDKIRVSSNKQIINFDLNWWCTFLALLQSVRTRNPASGKILPTMRHPRRVFVRVAAFTIGTTAATPGSGRGIPHEMDCALYCCCFSDIRAFLPLLFFAGTLHMVLAVFPPTERGGRAADNCATGASTESRFCCCRSERCV